MDAPRYTSLTRRIGGETVDAWALHSRAVRERESDPGVIVLSVGDADFDTPEPIVEAAIASLRNGDTHYSDWRGITPLRRAIAEQFTRETGAAVEPRQVLLTMGAQNALFSVALCLLEPGDELIVPEPMYLTYAAVAGSAGARIVPVPMRPEDGFTPRAADIAAAIGERTRAILINTPNNPTGSLIPEPTLREIAGLCLRHDLWLVSDEVYAPLVYDGAHFWLYALPELRERLVMIHSLSKSHAMPGWRVGWVIANPMLIGHLSNLNLCMLYGAPEFIHRGALLACNGDPATAREARAIRERLRQRRDLMYRTLADAPQVHCHEPASGMFMLMDVRGTGLGAEAFAERLYEETRVAVLACDAFGPSAAGHVRLSFAVSERELHEALGRIRGFLEALAGP